MTYDRTIFGMTRSLAVVGAVVSLLTACGGGGSPATTSPTPMSATPSPATPTSATPTTATLTPQPGDTACPGKGPVGSGGSGAPVDQQEAGRIATQAYGGTVKSVESDHHGGKPTWEVEIRDSHCGRIEVEVSKATGTIVDFEFD